MTFACAPLFAALLASTSEPHTGPWDAWLDAPIGRLAVRLELAHEGATWSAVVRNGAERLAIQDVRVDATTIVIPFPHYDAEVRATWKDEGTRLEGTWRKRAGPDAYRVLPFTATAGAPPVRLSPPGTPSIDGRWRVTFESATEPAVAVLASAPKSADGAAADPARVAGTILSTTGDYGFLEGRFDGALTLSGFDGGHAFAFTGELRPDGTLAGKFSSGDAYVASWTAVRDDAAKLPDEMSRARWNDAFGVSMLAYPDFDGRLVSLADARFDGRVRVLQLSGSWCPNCQDETALLAELDREYRDKGVSFVALCFEVTGERERDTRLARSLLARHGATYMGLLAGRNEKTAAAQALPALDRLPAFPTTVFLDRGGRVRAVHSGFSGPATGREHDELRARFRALLDELVAQKDTGTNLREDEILRELWRDERERAFVSFERGANGAWTFQSLEMTRFDRPTRMEPLDAGAVAFTTDGVRLGATTWHYDARAHVLLDASDMGHRLTPAARSPFPSVDSTGYSEFPLVLEGLSSTDAVRRRESAYYLALQLVTDRMTPPEFGGGQLDPGTAVNLVPLLSDADPLVRATAAWGAGVTELGGSPPAAAFEALIAGLEHGYAPVRRESARALGLLAHAPARTALERRAREDADPLARAAATSALAALPK